MPSPLDSRQLNAFVTLARTGTLTATAKELSLTNSAISHAMKALENDAGCRLLSRAGKKLVLTEAGEALLHFAERIGKEMDQARAAMKQLNQWGVHRLRLAADPALGELLLPRVVPKLQQDFPRLQMTLEMPGQSEALRRLEASEVSLVLGMQPARNDVFTFTPLVTDRFHLILAPAHPWAVQRHARREEIRKHPCILPGKANAHRRLVDDYFAAEDMALNTTIEVEGFCVIKSLVKAGLGVSVLPGWAVQSEVAGGSLATLSLGRRHLVQTWGLLHRRNRPLTALEHGFVQHCVAAGQQWETTAAAANKADAERT